MQGNNSIVINLCVSLAVLLMFGLIRFFFNKNILELIEKFKQKNFSLRQIKEELNVRTTASTIFNIFSYCMLSLFVFMVIDFYKVETGFRDYELFLVCVNLVPVVIVLKRWILMFVGNIFKINHLIKIYLFQASLTRKVLGLVLAVLLSLYFGFHHIEFIKAISFYFSLIVVALILIFTVYKMWNSLTKNSTFKFSLHFFLYLCTVELLPVLIIFKKMMK